MKTYKTCGVVMLPTNKEVHDTYCIDDLGYHTDHKLSLNGIEQHLYVTSDEEIKEGDWMIFNSIRLERQQFYVKDVSQCKKIIATTNPKLTLPQVDRSFILHHISEYNKGNKIEKVEVEYEERVPCDINGLPLKGISFHKMNALLTPKESIDLMASMFRDILKINPDNTINIKPIKESWTREEVEIKLLEWNECLWEEGGLLSNESLRRWIKENL